MLPQSAMTGIHQQFKLDESQQEICAIATRCKHNMAHYHLIKLSWSVSKHAQLNIQQTQTYFSIYLESCYRSFDDEENLSSLFETMENICVYFVFIFVYLNIYKFIDRPQSPYWNIHNFNNTNLISDRILVQGAHVGSLLTKILNSFYTWPSYFQP